MRGSTVKTVGVKQPEAVQSDIYWKHHSAPLFFCGDVEGIFLLKRRKEREIKIGRHFALALFLTGLFQTASAAQGEMGAGTPQFGVYSAPTGAHESVWALSNAITNFPAGCGDAP